MGRRSRRQGRRNKSKRARRRFAGPRPREISESKPPKAAWSWRGKLLAGILPVAGLLLTLLTLQPHITVSLEPRLNQAELFSQPIKVTNNGPFSITTVRLLCLNAKTTFGQGNYLKNVLLEAGEASIIPPDESKTFFCGIYGSTDVQDADVAVIAFYSSVAAPLQRKKRVERFVGTRSTDGTIRFLSQPSEGIAHLLEGIEGADRPQAARE